MAGAQVYWLLAEAQNFAAAAFDTQDLSTIRGGSAAMRLGVRAIDAALGANAENVTIGGSSAIWKLNGDEAQARRSLKIARETVSKGAYRHAAFAVVALATSSEEKFTNVRAKLAAAAARKRHAEARVAYPHLASDNNPYVGVCPVDFVRPVPKNGTTQKHPERDYATSQSVHERRRLGMDSKQKVLGDVTKMVPGRAEALVSLLEEKPEDFRPFALQISSISEAANPPIDLRATLRDKVAVIHLDGNSFSKLQNDALEKNNSVEGQQVFDHELQTALGTIVYRVLELVAIEDGTGAPSPEERLTRERLGESGASIDEVIRFETIVWGGDEVLFIAPARLGWQIAEKIAEVAECLSIGGTPLTFGVGIVFCHHDAPISRIKELVDSLATIAKSDSADPNGDTINGRQHTRFAPVVMESFDHSGGSVDDLMSKRAPKDEAHPNGYMTLSVTELKLLRQAAIALRGTEKDPGPLSRARLRLLARLVQYGSTHGTKTAATLIGENAQMAKQVGHADTLKLIDGSQWEGRFWRLLEEYWDYLLPLKTKAETLAGTAPEVSSNQTKEGEET